MRLPITFSAEFRGTQPGGEFVNDDGEKIEYGDKLKFEVDLADGDVSTIALSLAALDKVAQGFDPAKLAKGDTIQIEGTVTIRRNGGSYFRPVVAQAERVKSAA